MLSWFSVSSSHSSNVSSPTFYSTPIPTSFTELLLLLLSFLDLQHFLQSENVFSLQLVQLRLDVVDVRDDARDHHVVQSVHTAICHLDGFIQGNEGGLQRGKADQDLQEFRPDLTAFFQLLAAATQSWLLYALSYRERQIPATSRCFDLKTGRRTPATLSM